jgi:predicted aspartyl protease
LTRYQLASPDLKISIFDAYGTEFTKVALMDTGAGGGLWVAERIVHELSFTIDDTKERTQVIVGSDAVVRSQGTVRLTWKRLQGMRTFTETFNVFQSDHYDVILGMEFLGRHQIVPHFDLTNLMPMAEAKSETTRKILSYPMLFSSRHLAKYFLDGQKEREAAERQQQKDVAASEARRNKSKKKADESSQSSSKESNNR